MQEAPVVDIVIPVRNDWTRTRECLESLRAHTAPGYRVLLVDNGSTDATATEAAVLADVVLRNDAPRNFAASVNQGIDASTAPFVCVLNNDVVVGRGWLTRLLRVIAVDPAIAAVGPITSNDRDWQGLRYLRQHWGLDLPIDQIPTDDLDQWNRYLALRFTRSHVEIDGMLAFFCTLLRRESIERAGRLDELFDFGGEDDDFCYRLQREGAKLALSLQTYVIHRGGVSAGPRRAAVDERHRRNLARLAKKWPHRYGAIAS